MAQEDSKHFYSFARGFRGVASKYMSTHGGNNGGCSSFKQHNLDNKMEVYVFLYIVTIV